MTASNPQEFGGAEIIAFPEPRDTSWLGPVVLRNVETTDPYITKMWDDYGREVAVRQALLDQSDIQF